MGGMVEILVEWWADRGLDPALTHHRPPRDPAVRVLETAAVLPTAILIIKNWNSFVPVQLPTISSLLSFSNFSKIIYRKSQMTAMMVELESTLSLELTLKARQSDFV